VSNYYNSVVVTGYLENNKNMADVIRGTIQHVPRPREFAKGNKVTYYYSIKVNDVYYSVGTKKPPAEGTLVEFEAEQNARGYWDVTKAGLRVVSAGVPTSSAGAGAVAAARSAPAAGKPLSKDDYWRNKEERDIAKEAALEAKDKIIQLQSCRNSAIEFVKLLLTQVPHEDKNGNIKLEPSLKLPANPAKREAVLFEAVKRYTQEFVEENNNNNKSENKNNNEQPQVEAAAQDVGQTASEDDSEWEV